MFLQCPVIITCMHNVTQPTSPLLMALLLQRQYFKLTCVDLQGHRELPGSSERSSFPHLVFPLLSSAFTHSTT